MDGILIIKKEKGYTSRDIVNIVGKIFNTKKIGHTGTLDPMAEGVLVLCMGKALKVCELLVNHTKEYIAEIVLGIETDTLDMEGNVISTSTVDIDEKQIIEAVNSFKGKYWQEVPKYSAVKIKGKKLYEYAREGLEVELPKREVNIMDINVCDNVEYKNGLIYFKIKCLVSKGTYIRSLVRDIGNSLNCPATMNGLVRLKQGNFNIEDAWSIDDIKLGKYRLLDIAEAFPDIPKIKVNKNIAFKVKNGVILDNFFDSELAFLYDEDDNLLALYKKENNKCRSYKMFI